MGDMREIFQDMKEYNKNKKDKLSLINMPLIEKMGGKKIQDGVWFLNDWFLYPSKGFAMQKKTNFKISLNKFLKETR